MQQPAVTGHYDSAIQRLVTSFDGVMQWLVTGKMICNSQQLGANVNGRSNASTTQATGGVMIQNAIQPAPGENDDDTIPPSGSAMQLQCSQQLAG